MALSQVLIAFPSLGAFSSLFSNFLSPTSPLLPDLQHRSLANDTDTITTFTSLFAID